MMSGAENTGRPLRVLIIEDSEDDLHLLVRELRRSGFEPSYQCVKSATDLISMLDRQEWDLFIGDYTMPGFSGTQALSIVRSRGIEAPFIFVSGTIGEDVAVSAMRAGAQDYVIKGNLKRLGPAIERELRESDARRERARAEARRQLAEDRFRQILMIAADAIISIDDDMRIVIFNQGAEAIFGYRADEAIGKFVDLLLPSGAVAAQRRTIAEMMSSPAISQRITPRENLAGRRKNGEEFPIDLTVSKMSQGGKTTFTAIIRDISESLRAEQQLRLLRRAVEQSANLIILTGANGTIEYVNPKLLDVMGYSADEVLGHNPSLWKSGDMDGSVYKELWETILAGNEWRGEFRNRRKDGGVIIVFSIVSPIKDERGNITHFLCMQEDITRIREIEAEHRRSQKLQAIGQLTGGFVHDFNNLLTIAIGNLDLLLEEPAAKTGRIEEFGQAALESVLRGAGLTRKLLAYARGQVLQPMAFDLNGLVSGTADLLRRTLGEQIVVETALSGDLWPAHADPEQLETALTNLAINSRDAMPDGGRLTIETANKHLDEEYAAWNPEVTPGDYVMLAVSDTGMGIPTEIVNHVFEPFFTTKEQGKGTGLGLSMVYGFVKQSRGHIKIYSEPGHGTTIRLYLPRARDGVDEKNEAAQEDKKPPTSSAKILVVDDNPDLRGIVIKQLAGFGYSVMEAQDGQSALDIICNDETIELLFTDIVMPGGMTGVELAREARKIRPFLKVLLTSGFAEATVQNGGQPGETINILSKPYRKQDLARKIQEVLTGI
jgi:two-component system, cell cycle sensor histidine kinase and response regulator CckA